MKMQKDFRAVHSIIGLSFCSERHPESLFDSPGGKNAAEAGCSER